MTTPGYKRAVAFEQFLTLGTPSTDAGEFSKPGSAAIDFTAGKQIETGNPYDLTIAGDGFFAVQQGDGVAYTRGGQFKRDVDGRLTTADGLPVQTRDGGELVLKTEAFEVLDDGAVLEGGELVGRLAVMTFEDMTVLRRAEGGLFTAPAGAAGQATAPSVRQGALESANVSTGDEMVAIMEALRRAEAGQRLVNVYDDLMGRALAVFGQA